MRNPIGREVHTGPVTGSYPNLRTAVCRPESFRRSERVGKAIAVKKIETPQTVHGRLLEAVHVSGYSFERACSELEWLLDDERWKLCGDGYDSISDFIATVDLSPFNIDRPHRKRLAQKLNELQASQRATAKALGVDETTIRRDVGKRDAANAAESPERNGETTDKITDVAANAAPAPVTASGTDAARKLEEKAHVSRNSGEIEWYTPAEYTAAAAKVMGGIDLDPASSKPANKVVGAAKFFTEKDDGLKKEWSGRVWMNPPYSNSLVGPFCEKLVESVKSKSVSQACVLLNNATETKAFQATAKSATAICFPEGRIRFWYPDRESFTPLQGQSVLYFGNRTAAFLKTFGEFGFVAECKR